MRRFPHLASVAFVALLAPAAGAQQAPCALDASIPSRFCAIATRFERYVAADSAPAAAVAVVSGGRIVWERGFGVADRERGTPATPATVFFLASVSKSITALAVMQLVGRHRLELDVPVSRYLEPGLQRVYVGSPESVTVRRLLQMTAGVPHVVRFAWADDSVPAPSEAELIRHFGFVAFPPGRKFEYSNMSFGVLQHVVTRVSGQPFGEYLERAVFRPYGMTHSAETIAPALAPFEAKVYGRGSREALPLVALQPEGGAGLHSSAHDLGLLASHLLDAPLPVASRATVDEMWRGAIPQPYALGWWRIATPNGLPVLVADGNATGTAASVVISPTRDVAAVVLFDDGSAPSLPVAQDLIEAAAGDVALASSAKPSSEPAAPPYFAELPFRGDGAWTGTWRGTVQVDGHGVPLELRIAPTGAIVAALDRDTAAVVTNVQTQREGLLTGRLAGALAASDTRGQPHRLEIALRRDGDRLVGHLTATSRGERTHFVLPYFVELRRSDP